MDFFQQLFKDNNKNKTIRIEKNIHEIDKISFLNFINKNFNTKQIFSNEWYEWLINSSTNKFKGLYLNDIPLDVYNNRSLNCCYINENKLIRLDFIDFYCHNNNLIPIEPIKNKNKYTIYNTNLPNIDLKPLFEKNIIKYICPIKDWYIVNTKYEFEVLNNNWGYWCWFYNTTSQNQKKFFQIYTIPEFKRTFIFKPNLVFPLICGKHTLALVQINNYSNKLVPEILCFLTQHHKPDWILRMLFQKFHKLGFDNIIYSNFLLKQKYLNKIHKALTINKFYESNLYIYPEWDIQIKYPNQFIIPIH